MSPIFLGGNYIKLRIFQDHTPSFRRFSFFILNICPIFGVLIIIIDGKE